MNNNGIIETTNNVTYPEMILTFGIILCIFILIWSIQDKIKQSKKNKRGEE